MVVEIGPLKEEMQEEVTTAEMKYMRKKAGYTGTDYKTNTETAKELNITLILDKIQEYRSNWFQRINRMPHNRLPRIIKNCRPKGKKRPGETIKETSRSVRPEQVNKWANCMLAR